MSTTPLTTICPNCLRFDEKFPGACRYVYSCSVNNAIHFIPVSIPLDSIPAFDPSTNETINTLQNLMATLDSNMLTLDSIVARLHVTQAKLHALHKTLKD